MPAPLPIGIIFLNAVTGVTPGSGEVFENEASSLTTYSGPRGYGYVADGGYSPRTRNNALDRRLVGCHFTNTANTQVTYRVDLPAAGTYNIRLAMGDPDNPSPVFCELFDGATSKGVLTTGSTAGALRWKDATGVERTSVADWVANNAALSVTFTGTTMFLRIGNGLAGGSGVGGAISYLYIEAAADTTAPTLSTAAAAGGSLTCSGSISTNEGNGTLYAVVTASATAPSAAQVQAGQDHTGAAALRVISQAVTATGTQTIPSGGVTAGTRYMHFMHRDAAGNNSAVASSASFIVTGADTTPPDTGTITIGTVTDTSIQFSWVAGTDNVGVVGYDVSSNGGSTWTSLGNVLTHTFTGLTPNTAYALRVRARDAAGNVDGTPSSASQTTLQPLATTVSFTVSGAAGLSGIKGAVFDQVTPDLWAAPIKTFNNATINGSGLCNIDISGVTTRRVGEFVCVVLTNSDGSSTAGGSQSATRRFFHAVVAAN